MEFLIHITFTGNLAQTRYMGAHPMFFHFADVISWVKELMQGDMANLFLAGIWWIWCWRNNMLLGEEKWSIQYVIRIAHNSHDEFNVPESIFRWE